MPLKKIEPDSADRIAVLVIAKYGVGKTSLIRTILGQEYTDGQWTGEPSDEKICVLSAESGLLAVRDLVKAGKVEGFEIGSLAEFKEAYDMLSGSAPKNGRPWIFIDSLTEIAARCEETMTSKYPNKADSFKMWGEYTKTLESLVKGFRDLRSYNVVFLCLETVEKDENNKRYVAPAMSGKGIKEKLPSYFDLVLYMQIMQDDDGNDRRVFLTQPLNEFPAKDRSGKLDTYEKPNLLTIKTKILED